MTTMAMNGKMNEKQQTKQNEKSVEGHMRVWNILPGENASYP